LGYPCNGVLGSSILDKWIFSAIKNRLIPKKWLFWRRGKVTIWKVRKIWFINQKCLDCWVLRNSFQLEWSYFLGNLFHIDFGYILGRDPKPLPPPMKLSKEMVWHYTLIYTIHWLWGWLLHKKSKRQLHKTVLLGTTSTRKIIMLLQQILIIIIHLGSDLSIAYYTLYKQSLGGSAVTSMRQTRHLPW